MSTQVTDIGVVEYNGAQGSHELKNCTDASINRTKSGNRVKTMTRTRVPIAFQRGTKEVSISLTIVPELVDKQVDWLQVWESEEEFLLVIEKGLDGEREQFVDCIVVDVNDSFNEAGESTQEVSIEVLDNRAE